MIMIYLGDDYDINNIDITAHEILTGRASVWDDVFYKLYFVSGAERSTTSSSSSSSSSRSNRSTATTTRAMT